MAQSSGSPRPRLVISMTAVANAPDTGVSAPAARDALDFARYVDSYDPATRAA
jgi:hypothetical protein